MCASWPLGSLLLEYIYALSSLGPFIFGMPGILSPILGPSTDPGVKLGGIIAPYHAHRFGNGHIPSSTPFMEDFYSFCLVFTLVVTLMGVVVDASMLGLHLTFPFCPSIHRIVSFGCSCHDHSSLYPIVGILY